jgi:transmembrane sensor
VPARQDVPEHPESLIARSLRGELGVHDQPALERHLADCGDCAAEVEGARILAAAMAPGKWDETLNRAAAENALRRLAQRRSLGQSLRAWAQERRLLRPAVGFAVLGAVALVTIGLVLQHSPWPSATPLASAPLAPPLVLDDGSDIAPATEATVLQVAEQSAVRTTVHLRSGGARFRIRHDSRRLFRVEVGPIEVEDLGTVFRIDHLAGGKVHVAVTEGRVAVLYPARNVRIELSAGEERLFATTEPEPAQASSPTDGHDATVSAGGPRSASRGHAPEDPAALLLAADTARRSHQPQAAVAPLRRIVEHFLKDPRAPSAAFTLGWVLLTDLGQPRAAAAAFLQAERMAPSGALAEDAAARVAEAWQKAGDSRRAAEAARHYERAYPNGRYLALTRALSNAR